MLDILEPRLLHDGTVTVITTDDTIHIKGDESPNVVVLQMNTTLDGDDGATGIETGAGTELVVNGQPVASGSYIISQATLDSIKHFTIDLGDGNDTLRTNSYNVNRARSILNGIDVYGGNGDDRVELLTSTLYFRYSGGNGDDRVGVASGVTIYGNAEIRPDAGRDRVMIGGTVDGADVSVRGKFLLVDTNGPSAFTAERLRVRREAVITTGNSVDRINLNRCSFYRAATIATRGGTDLITINQSVFHGPKMIDAGGDGDAVTES